MKKIIIPALFSLLVLGVIFSYQSGQAAGEKLRVVFCDVGQGDAIYIRTPGGADILVDGGRGRKVLDCLIKYMPLLDKKLELVFATHPDADHIGGLVDVLKNYEVESFNSVDIEKDTDVYQELKGLIVDRNIAYKNLTAGNSFMLSDGVAIKTYWPEPNYQDSDANNHSLVQVLTYGEFDLILTGDIPYGILNNLSIDGSDIEIFKLPHHGSKTGIDSVTMAKIEAEMAIISAGRDNPYHHPHPSVISLLEKAKMQYLRTDEIGDIEIVTDGYEIKFVN